MRRITEKKALAAGILAVVEHEEHYNQGTWLSRAFFEDNDDYAATGLQLRSKLAKNVCGTTGCVAGTAVVLSISKLDKYNYAYDKVVFADGTAQSVSLYAGDILGLSHDEAEWLFSAGRELSDVKEALTLLAAGESISDLVSDYYDDSCDCGCMDDDD